MEKNKEFEKKILQINLLESKFQESQEQLQIIDKEINNLQLTLLALQDLEGIKKDTEMLAQIGENIFVKSKIQNSKELIVGIGSKVFTKKSIEETKKILNEKIDELIEIREKIYEQANQILNSISDLEKKLREKS